MPGSNGFSTEQGAVGDNKKLNMGGGKVKDAPIVKASGPPPPDPQKEYVENFEDGKYIPKEYNTGFYFDAQLKDPMLTLTLHPNTELSGGEWKKPEGALLEKTMGEQEWDCYRLKPIAKAIMTEDFSYSITNNFTDFQGGNVLESLFETAKPYATIAGKISDAVKKGVISLDGDDLGSAAVGFLNNMGSKISKYAGKAEQFLNKSLVVQGSRFTYYNGTSFSVNNMEMKFTLFSDWDEGNYITVEDQLEEIRPYVMGTYSDSSEFWNNTLGEDSTLGKGLSQYIGMQSPPGGFAMSAQNLNTILKGTLRLNIGGRFALSNLVIKNMGVSISKAMAKNPTKPGATNPLYAEVTLQLAPASMIIDSGLSKILTHEGMKEQFIESSTNMYKEYLNKNIKTLKETLK